MNFSLTKALVVPSNIFVTGLLLSDGDLSCKPFQITLLTFTILKYFSIDKFERSSTFSIYPLSRIPQRRVRQQTLAAFTNGYISFNNPLIGFP